MEILNQFSDPISFHDEFGFLLSYENKALSCCVYYGKTSLSQLNDFSFQQLYMTNCNFAFSS